MAKREGQARTLRELGELGGDIRGGTRQRPRRRFRLVEPDKDAGWWRGRRKERAASQRCKRVALRRIAYMSMPNC